MVGCICKSTFDYLWKVVTNGEGSWRLEGSKYHHLSPLKLCMDLVAWRSIIHSFLIYTENRVQYERGESRKKVALVIPSTFQFETDFDAHGCNTNIISFTHFPHFSYSVCRETCQRLRRMIFKVFIFITKNSPVLTLTLKHTLLFNRGIFSKITPLQQRGVGAVVFSFCFLIDSLLSHFTEEL